MEQLYVYGFWIWVCTGGLSLVCISGMLAKDLRSASLIGAKKFFATTESKLIVMVFSTGGLYGIYWFAMNWRAAQLHTGKKISPVVRGVFSPLFTVQLFKIIDDAAKDAGYSGHLNSVKWGVFLIAVTVLSAVVTGPSPLFAVMAALAGLLSMILSLNKIQAVIKYYNTVHDSSYTPHARWSVVEVYAAASGGISVIVLLGLVLNMPPGALVAELFGM